MYGYRYDSSSEGSDTENLTSIKSLDLSYLSLNCYALYLHFQKFEPTKFETIDTMLLVHNNLQSVPINIVKFNNLRTLDISNNHLDTISEFITNLPLTTLIAKNNRITNDGLPKSFSALKSLKVFNFSGNEFTSFPNQILEAANLEYLYLGNNRIMDLPKGINNLKRLKILCMGGNRLCNIPASVGTLYNLQALILSDNALETIPSSIADLKNLRSLLIHKNQLKTLPTEIIALKGLMELSLRDNPLVIRFVSDLNYNPPSLLELAGRIVKLYKMEIQETEVPGTLIEYLNSAHHCVNPKCKGVYFDNRVEHIKFVDFCGKYRVPLLQYLCSQKCVGDNKIASCAAVDNDRMRHVLLG